jgi:hypothetical protein
MAKKKKKKREREREHSNTQMHFLGFQNS